MGIIRLSLYQIAPKLSGSPDLPFTSSPRTIRLLAVTSVNLTNNGIGYFGVAGRLVAAAVSMRQLSSLLFNVKPVDRVAYGAASVGLG